MSHDLPGMHASPIERLKYRVLQYLPGERGYHYARKLRRTRWRDLDAQFTAAQEATRGKVAIDLGANMGEFALRLARTASHVYAFEPDPDTVEKLRANTRHDDRIEVIAAAAGAEAGEARLLRHVDYDSDPDMLSQSSSIEVGSNDLQSDSAAVSVPVVDFVAFLRDNDLRVGVLKIDIEGSEVALLEALLDSPERERVDYIFCETHECDFAALRPRFQALRARVQGVAHPVINLDWL